jgi:N-methylhydantoinase B
MRLPGEKTFGHVELVRHLVPAGTVARIATAGGGGFGNPHERDPERVKRDVREGFVSLESAREDYGVSIDPVTLEIEEDETARLRSRR